MSNYCSVNKLILLVGLSGSGKSTYAQKLKEQNENFAIVSSDQMRIKLFGDVNVQDKNDILFAKIHKDVEELLQCGSNVIVDATNLTYKTRRPFIDIAKKIAKQCRSVGCDHCYSTEAHIIATDFDECSGRNLSRDRVVPQEVLFNQLKKFQVPFYGEGFDNIKIIDDKRNSVDVLSLWSVFPDFNQGSKYHKHTFKDHSSLVFSKVYRETDNSNLHKAALYHDIGKMFTKVEKEDGHFSYHGHANVGAYYYMTNLIEDIHTDETLYIMALINYHMLPYDWSSDETYIKYKKLFGHKLFYDLLLINEADKSAH